MATVSAQLAGNHSLSESGATATMAEIVNLRTARKRAARQSAEQAAAENRRAHGATKKDRAEASAERARIDKTLDSHRIEPGDRR